MSVKQQLASELDDLERKLRRLRNNVEGGAIRDGAQIGPEIRKLLRNEVDRLEHLIRQLD